MAVCVNATCTEVWDFALKYVLGRRGPGARATRGVPAASVLTCVPDLDPGCASGDLLGTSQVDTIKGVNRAGRTLACSLCSVPVHEAPLAGHRAHARRERGAVPPTMWARRVQTVRVGAAAPGRRCPCGTRLARPWGLWAFVRQSELGAEREPAEASVPLPGPGRRAAPEGDTALGLIVRETRWWR